ncbi:PAS domain-containing sensor histidine kinase [Granulibacter bethesdensis]|uniref:hybrid sensor histidine kinase/response regulator n=1 Tax=Granulibacter bethesdensis TaxID=364410 RepID=UPI000AD31DD8|nr:PAS domain-containing sensor histidine kinase [Granulibacter bethesdensis]
MLSINTIPGQAPFLDIHGAEQGNLPFLPHTSLPALAKAVMAGEELVTHLRDEALPSDMIRPAFFAGHPVITPSGRKQGALCVMGATARTLSPAQTDRLLALARLAGMQSDPPDDQSDHNGRVPEQGDFLELLGTSPDCMKILTTDGKLLFISNAGLKALGISDPSHIIGQSWPHLWDDPVRSQALTAIAKARSGGVGRLEGTTLNSQGKASHWDITITPLLDQKGSITRLMAVSRDITEAREAQQALKYSEARFRLMTETLPQIIWMTDQQGDILYVSEKWEHFSGRSTRHLLQKGRWMSFVHPDDRQTLLTAWAAARQEGSLKCEYRMRHRSGVYRWFLLTAQPEPDPTGEPLRWFGSCTDIDVERNIREALAVRSQGLEQEIAHQVQELERIWCLSRDLLAILRYDGGILSINPAWEAILGWDNIKDIENPIDTLCHPDDLPEVEHSMEQMRQGQTVVSQPVRILHVDGSYRWISWNAVPFDGLIYATGRDVTDLISAEEHRKELEAQLHQSQKMEAVGQLTGGIAHDFNNLLTALSGSLELMQTNLDRGRLQSLPRYIATAHKAVERGASLTHRLLAFSRRQTLSPRTLDPATLMTGMAELIRSICGPSIQVQTIFQSMPALIQCDPNQLENGLLNLVINARDAMPQGGTLIMETGIIKIPERHVSEVNETWLDSALSNFQPGDYVVITVQDTGIGMTEDVMRRAFDPFFTTKPIGQGTGLGLSMIYGFIKQTGGHVRLKSSPGSGTTIRLYFPCYHGDLSTAQHTGQMTGFPASTSTSSGHTASGTIMVVDDEESIRHLIKETLQDQGYKTVLADHAAAALMLLKTTLQNGDRIDGLITDIGLPGSMNGRELVAEALSLIPDLPVLLMTGYDCTSHATDRPSTSLQENLDILAKPFSMDTLLQKLSSVLV